MQFFVTGIGTDVGKTVCSAILCKAWKAAYWKPVQAGDLHFSDSDKVRQFTNNELPILSERYRLQTPASPHYAAAIDGVEIKAEDIILPETEQHLLIEGAGGLLVPLNNQGLLYGDLIKKWHLPVVVVSRHYLGSINHTLLTLHWLAQNHINVLLLIWTGDENPATERVIQQHYPELKTHRIPWADELTPAFVNSEAERIPTLSSLGL